MPTTSPARTSKETRFVSCWAPTAIALHDEGSAGLHRRDVVLELAHVQSDDLADELLVGDLLVPSVPDDLAVPDHGDAVAEVAHLVEAVADVDHRAAGGLRASGRRRRPGPVRGPQALQSARP